MKYNLLESTNIVYLISFFLSIAYLYFSISGGDIVAFAENLKRLREEKGMTQAELAKRVGIAQSMIAQYERYMKIPTITVGVSIAKTLGTTCEKLIDDAS